jgi:prepilin-type N-terminal cleavage/methylation domain-containing protein
MRAKGFTLIELAVVLAIIAVLAAVLTPVVTNYLEQARTARAMSDAKVVADAVRLYHRDMGIYPVYDDTTDLLSDTGAVTAKKVIKGPGTAATAGSGGAADWDDVVATDELSVYLSNALNRASNPALGKAGYRGPYLGNLESDPWGNAYYLTAEPLDNSSTDWGFVISAGANGVLDTDPSQVRSGALSVTSDDVVVAVK